MPDDLESIRRRPSRGFPRWISKWLANCRSLDDLRIVGRRIDDERVAGKVDEMADDIGMLAGVAATGADTRELLETVRDRIGLGGAMEMLDGSKGSEATASHLDDLEGLIQVADLHDDPGRLRAVAARRARGLGGRGGRAAGDGPPRQGPGVGPGRRLRRQPGPAAAPAQRELRGRAPGHARRDHEGASSLHGARRRRADLAVPRRDQGGGEGGGDEAGRDVGGARQRDRPLPEGDGPSGRLPARGRRPGLAGGRRGAAGLAQGALRRGRRPRLRRPLQQAARGGRGGDAGRATASCSPATGSARRSSSATARTSSRSSTRSAR